MDAESHAQIAPVDDGLDEARLIVENGPARRIAEIVAPALRDLGFGSSG